VNADRKRSILVPVFGDDITHPALEAVEAMLASGDACVVLLHVTPATSPVTCEPQGKAERHSGVGTSSAWHDDLAVPRWRELAARAHPVFVDAIFGEPATVVLAQASRFGSDVIVLGRPEEPAGRDGWIDSAIDRISRAAPDRARVVGPPVRVPTASGAFTSWPALPRFVEATC
jgi:hypothetical protein